MPITRNRKLSLQATFFLFVFSLNCGVSEELAPTEAEQQIQAGHWKRARALVERRYHQAPDDALANYLLSQIRYAFGDQTAPLTFAEKAVLLNGGVGKYHRQLAEVLGVEAQHAGPFRLLVLARRFRKEIDTAIGLDSRDTQALRDLMEFYLVAPGIAGGDFGKAEATAERIQAINAPEGLLAKARIAAYRKQNGAQEAWLREAAQAQPPSYGARVELGEFELGKQHPGLAEAAAAAQDGLKLDRTRVGSYAVLAAVDAVHADWGGLEGILAESLKQVPDDLTPYFRAAEQLLKAGRDPARAEQYLRKYLSEEPEGNEPSAAEARRKLALAIAAQGGAGRAIAEGVETHGASTEVAVQ